MRIKELREQAGISSSMLANQMKLAPSTVCRWENGENIPTSDKLPELADILGCSIDDLFGRNTSKQTLA